MSKALPPLNGLRAFEAAARLSSFTKAAQELNVTPGALSHQIGGLEEFFELSLFQRRARGVELTPQGRILYPGLLAGFGLIKDAVMSLRDSNSKVLVVSTPPGLTSKWLARRLYRFAENHPEIELRIASSVAYANFTTDGVNVAIRNVARQRANDDNLIYEKLIDDDMVAVCSPKLIARIGPIDRKHRATKIPLIHDDQLAGQEGVPIWQEWFRQAGIEGRDVARGLRFSSSDHALDAALEGAGMLLTHSILAHDELRSERLVMPFNVVIPSQRAYYFVYPKEKKSATNICAFRDWIRGEISADQN